MTIKEFTQKHDITASSVVIDENPHDREWQANHYMVTLARQYKNDDGFNAVKRFSLAYSKGFALKGKPSAIEVLECLMLDTQGLEAATGFEDWAENYGYDPDSRKALANYRVTEKQVTKLREFLGHDLWIEFLNTEEGE